MKLLNYNGSNSKVLDDQLFQRNFTAFGSWLCEGDYITQTDGKHFTIFCTNISKSYWMVLDGVTMN